MENYCKHFVPGALYQDIVNRFYVIPMDGLNKYRLNVSVRYQHWAHKAWTYVDFAHSPLCTVSQIYGRGLDMVLYQNDIALNINKHDCHDGLNLGTMAASGSRLYNQNLIEYKGTTDYFPKLKELATSFFKRYGFFKWVQNLHN